MTITERKKELKRRQGELAPREAIGKFTGQWVVLRDGVVVANDADPHQLERRGLEADDVVLFVGDGGSLF